MTLVELLISIVVGSIVTVGIVFQITQTMKFAQLPRQAAQATYLYQEKMEEILYIRRTQGYDAVSQANFPDETPIVGFEEFDRLVTISDAAAGSCTSGSNCKSVTITIRGNSSHHYDSPSFLVITDEEQVFEY